MDSNSDKEDSIAPAVAKKTYELRDLEEEAALALLDAYGDSALLLARGKTTARHLHSGMLL